MAEKQAAGDSRCALQPKVKKKRVRRRPGEEEEPVLRTTCDNCTNAKVKCNGARPCLRCKSKNIGCEYTFKKRCGPKRRKGIDGSKGGSDNEGLLASCAAATVGFDEHLRGMAVVLGKDEVECVGVFMQTVNSFLPMTTFDTVKEAANPGLNGVAGAGSPGSADDSQDEEMNQLHHSRKALLHGAIAVGAEFLGKEEASVNHAGIARQEVKECFDAAVPELVGAYLILALYWTHQMDSPKIARYIGLAHQSNGIICEPPGPLVASLTFISVVLYDAKVLSAIGCRVAPPGLSKKAGSPSFNTPAAYQERVLKILSFVLLAIHNRSIPNVDPSVSTGDWQPSALAEHVDEAKSLLDKGAPAGPNDMSRCVVVVLQAYFLLLKDDRRLAIVITEKIADLVVDNPLVLHLPIVWSMVSCVRSLLEGANRTIAVERLQSVMAPLVTHLGFSSDESLIQQELMSVFVTKQRGTRGSATSGAAPPLGQDSIFARSKGQTSSLNVTAGDYSGRNRPAMDIMNLEPSPAPRQRSLPPTISRQNSSGGGIRGDGGALSPSLISAAMASSAASVLASSPPPSRAGALARAANGRDSLSIPHPYERAPASLLQLDIYPDATAQQPFQEAVPGVVPIPQPVDIVHPGIVPLLRSSSTVSSAVPEEVRKVKSESGTPTGDTLLEDAKAADRRDLMLRQQMQGSFKTNAATEGLLDDGKPEDRRDIMLRQRVQASFKAHAATEGLLEDVKPEDRRDIMLRQRVQPSFKADAPVSLEQVESNMARLGVAAADGDADLNRIVTSMDLDAAAELIAAKTSFIS